MIERLVRNEGTQHSRRFRPFEETWENWHGLTLYGRFEQAVAMVLTAVISGVIIVAVFDLIWAVAGDLYLRRLEPLDHAVFQGIFGMIMTVLIAMEFNHTILSIVHRKESVVQLRTVILIALLALARKFIVIDLAALPAMSVFSLGFAVLSLGCVYWLVRQQDYREDAETKNSPGAP